MNSVMAGGGALGNNKLFSKITKIQKKITRKIEFIHNLPVTFND